MNRREEAEKRWQEAVRLRPSYFEAVEHLIGLLCSARRGREAVKIIEFVERSLSADESINDYVRGSSSDQDMTSNTSSSIASETTLSDNDDAITSKLFLPSDHNLNAKRPSCAPSGFAIPESANGRMLALVHAKGNMMYALGDISGAAKAFEDAVLLGAGMRQYGMQGLINHITSELKAESRTNPDSHSPSSLLLLPPDRALRTAQLTFPSDGQLPGLRSVPDGIARTAAIATTSNALLSLAKLFQDGMSGTHVSRSMSPSPSGIDDILALYYLSLSLQPSPSTANNVGILLASIPQSTPLKASATLSKSLPRAIPNVQPGSGVALALAYYNYGLLLDPRHPFVYCNLGSLLRDLGHVTAAIRMYEQAVACDPGFDIALANLANAVKDHGQIGDAIGYYKRAVDVSPDFAEAVCGLANALNSVCDWTGRGGISHENGTRDPWHVDGQGMLVDARGRGTASVGYMTRVIDTVEKQLADGKHWGRHTLKEREIYALVHQLELTVSGGRWSSEQRGDMRSMLSSWAGADWEGARIIGLVERATKNATHRWYHDRYIEGRDRPASNYPRPRLPSSLSTPNAPTVLPFHTFTCPVSANDVRSISQRNGLRISCSTLNASWIGKVVYRPPSPPNPQLNVGYVSSDFNNHPLSHLMQSVFGMHDIARVKAFCYATTESDRSPYRQQIEREAPVFRDASGWAVDRLVDQIVQDEIHILVNLNGYTRGARNEVFAARPAPVQMSFMGFAGTLGAEWCDYLLADETAIPADTTRPGRRNIDLEDQTYNEEALRNDGWVYSENIIFARDTFFCCDHRQSAPDSQEVQLSWEDEQNRRWKMRKELFPSLSDDAVILGNFNQLYKVSQFPFNLVA